MRKDLLIIGIVLFAVGGIVFFNAFYTLRKIGPWGVFAYFNETAAGEYAKLETTYYVSAIVAIVGVIFTVLGSVLKPSPKAVREKKERKPINKKWAGITIGIVAIAVISLVAFVYLKPGPEDLIIGRWRGQSGNCIFDTEGKLTFIDEAGERIETEYKWLDKDTIKCTYPLLGIGETFNVWVSKNTLTLVSLDGKESKEFHKVGYPSAKEKKGPLKEVFTLKSLVITTDKTYPTVLLSFKILDDVTLSLIDPTGVETDKEYVELGRNGTKLHLIAELGEVPKKGNYKLVVKDIMDRVIFTKDFSSTKPVKAIKKELKFYTNKEKYDYKKDNKIVINIKNVGEECFLIPNVEMVLFNENTSIRAGRGEIERKDLGTIWVTSKETRSFTYSFVPRQGIIISPKYSFKFYSEGEFIGGSNIFNCEIIQPE
jgi:hypothetical protein